MFNKADIPYFDSGTHKIDWVGCPLTQSGASRCLAQGRPDVQRDISQGGRILFPTMGKRGETAVW